MEFTIERDELLQGLYLTQGIVERRTTIPILANVLLESGTDTIAETAHEALPLFERAVLDRLEYSPGRLTSRRVIGERDRVQAELLQRQRTCRRPPHCLDDRIVPHAAAIQEPGCDEKRRRHAVTHQDRQSLRCIVGVAVVERDAHRSRR